MDGKDPLSVTVNLLSVDSIMDSDTFWLDPGLLSFLPIRPLPQAQVAQNYMSTLVFVIMI